jgi:hypothetical protein
MKVVLNRKYSANKIGIYFPVLIVLCGFLSCQTIPVMSQSALSQLENMAGSKVVVPAVSAPSAVGGYSNSKSSVGSSVLSSPSNAIATGIMQMMISNILSTDPAKEQAELEAKQKEQERLAAEAEEQRQIQAAIEQERYNNMMKLYKQPSGSENLQIKTLSTVDMNNINGEAETLSHNATKQFEPATETGNFPVISGGNDFFGIPVSSPDFNTLTDADNDPNIVDLRNAKELIAKDLKISGNVNSEDVKNKNASVDKKELTEDYCNKLRVNLTAYIDDRSRFQKTIDLTYDELNKWKEQNNAALWNSAISGISLITDIFLKHVELRTKTADEIKKYLLQLSGAKNKDAIYGYIKILDNVINLQYNVPQKIDYSKKVVEYATFSRDATQTLAENIAKSDQDVLDMLNDPKFKELLLNEGNSASDAEQFITGKTIDAFLEGPVLRDKLVSSFSKTMPVVAWCQFAVDQAYHATDWMLSYKNICNLNNVSGKEYEAAQYIQNKIFETQSMIQECPVAAVR